VQVGGGVEKKKGGKEETVRGGPVVKRGKESRIDCDGQEARELSQKKNERSACEKKKKKDRILLDREGKYRPADPVRRGGAVTGRLQSRKRGATNERGGCPQKKPTTYEEESGTTTFRGRGAHRLLHRGEKTTDGRALGEKGKSHGPLREKEDRLLAGWA